MRGAELGRDDEARAVLLGTAGMVTTFIGTAMGDCDGSLRPGVEEGAEGVWDDARLPAGGPLA